MSHIKKRTPRLPNGTTTPKYASLMSVGYQDLTNCFQNMSDAMLLISYNEKWREWLERWRHHVIPKHVARQARDHSPLQPLLHVSTLNIQICQRCGPRWCIFDKLMLQDPRSMPYHFIVSGKIACTQYEYVHAWITVWCVKRATWPQYACHTTICYGILYLLPGNCGANAGLCGIWWRNTRVDYCR